LSLLVNIMSEEISNVRCELVSGEDVSHFEGELKTFLESMGLPEKQEKASKDVIQTILWDWFNFITDHRLDHLEEKKKWYRENKSLKLFPNENYEEQFEKHKAYLKAGYKPKDEKENKDGTITRTYEKIKS